MYEIAQQERRNTTYFVFYCLYLSIYESNKSWGYFPYFNVFIWLFERKEERKQLSTHNPARQGTVWKLYKYLTGQRVFLVCILFSLIVYMIIGKTLLLLINGQ